MTLEVVDDQTGLHGVLTLHFAGEPASIFRRGAGIALRGRRLIAQVQHMIDVEHDQKLAVEPVDAGG